MRVYSVSATYHFFVQIQEFVFRKEIDARENASPISAEAQRPQAPPPGTAAQDTTQDDSPGKPYHGIHRRTGAYYRANTEASAIPVRVGYGGIQAATEVRTPTRSSRPISTFDNSG